MTVMMIYAIFEKTKPRFSNSTGHGMGAKAGLVCLGAGIEETRGGSRLWTRPKSFKLCFVMA